MEGKLNTNKLHKKVITDKTGKKTTKWVKSEEIKHERSKKQGEDQGTGEHSTAMLKFAQNTSTEKLQAYLKKPDKDADLSKIAQNELKKRSSGGSGSSTQQGKDRTTEAKKSGKNAKISWYNDLVSKYSLDRLPVGYNQEEVLVDETSPDKSWIMRWKDKKTGKTTFAYSREFLQRNADDKWNRIQKIKPKDIENVRVKTLDLLDGKDKKVAEVAAVIHIMAVTGLRVGARELFKKTGNRGVSTLSVDSVEIEGDKIAFNFVGKSYKENRAEIVSQKLADYLTKLKKGKKGDDFLFNANRNDLVEMFKVNMGFKEFKLKDLRTTVACEKAKEILYNDPTPPPPLSDKDMKKAIQNKLKHVFDVVSQRLNNTPAMTKSAYVHPNIIDRWLVDLGVEKESIMKGEKEEDEVKKLKEPTLEDIIEGTEKSGDPLVGDDYDEEVIDDDAVEDTYPLPDFMEGMDEEPEKKGKKIEKGEKYRGVAKDKTIVDIAERHNISVKDIMKQLRMGIGVEMEHTDEREIAMLIAKDHVWEVADYYTRLRKMEQEAEAEKNNITKGSVTGRDVSKLKKIKKVVIRGGRAHLGTFYVTPELSNVDREGDERELLKLKKKFKIGQAVTWKHSKEGILTGIIKNFSVSDIDKSGLAEIQVGSKTYKVSLLKISEAEGDFADMVDKRVKVKSKEEEAVDFPGVLSDLTILTVLGGSSDVKKAVWGSGFYALKTARGSSVDDKLQII